MAGNIWPEYEKKKNAIKHLPREQYEVELDKIIEELEFVETFTCNNCGELLHISERGNSELALQDNICEYCMEENDYGK